MLDNRFRSVFEHSFAPVGKRVADLGVTANQVTVMGLVLSGWAAVAISQGVFLAAVALLVVSALCDVLDGSIAKASGTTSSRGAFLDSVVDRFSDALVFGGLVWFFVSQNSGLFVMVPVAVGFLSLLVSYERARAEAVGVRLRGGLMERAERILLVAVGLVFSAWLPWILWLLFVLLVFTVAQRLWLVWAQTSPQTPSEPSK